MPNERLIVFLEKSFKKINDGDILVITSKIVALSEGRIIEKWDKKMKEAIIRNESDVVISSGRSNLTIKDGVVAAAAGIDESNAAGCLILLPKNSWVTAARVRRHFINKLQLKNLGVIISDSRSAPFKAGVTGVALGYAGFKGLKDYRRKIDIFGRPFHFSRVNVADSLAAAAVFVMGEGNEMCPLALISQADVEFSSRVNRAELKINSADDMYAPLFHFLSKSRFDKDSGLN